MIDPTLDFIRFSEETVAAFLSADPWFSNVPVICGHRADLAAQIDKALAEAVGLCVVVELTGGKVPDIGDVEDGDLSIIISESPLTNRSGEAATGKTAPGAVHKIISLLQAGSPARATTWKLLATREGVCYEITAIAPVAINITEES